MVYGVTEIVANPMPVSQPTAITLRDAAAWKTMFSTGTETQSGVRVNYSSSLGYPPFWRGVNLLANGVSRLPRDVFRRDGDNREVATSHPVTKLVAKYGRTSEDITSSTFFQTMTAHASATGNGYAWIIRDEMQRPVEFRILDPQQMCIRRENNRTWYVTWIDNEPVVFASREILHIKGLSHNGWAGMNPVQLMADAIGVGMAAQQFGARFFGQGSSMSGVLMVPGHFNEEKIRNTMTAWQEMNAGIQNAHKVALLQDGTKFQPMTIAPEQAQFLETRAFEVRTIALVLGLPPHLLGDDSRISYNSLEQENRAYLDHSLDPWLQAWESELNLKLLSEREQTRHTHFIEFNREAAVQMQVTEKIESIYKQIEIGLLTVNEGRRLLNEAEIGSDGDKRYHPANWMEVGAEPPEPAPAAPPADDDEDAADDETPEGDDVSNMLRQMIVSSVTDAIRVEQRRVIAAAKKPDQFIQAVDSYYEIWTTANITGLTSPAALAAKKQYADESKRQLLDVAGSSTTSTLQNNVSDLVATWTDRADALIESLMP